MNRNLLIGWTNILIFAILVSTASGQLLINEFLASNVSVNADILDFGDYSDWIEIYNGQDSVIDLSGYFLTDDLNNPLRWKIPANTTIEPNGYLIFWADGFDDYPGSSHYRDSWPWAGYTTQRYHTNFKLSSLGENIGLYMTTGDQNTPVIARGSEWKYLDKGLFPGQNWFNANFVDSTWQTGNAEFGYGEGDEQTLVDYGDNPENKYPTTYFRTYIEISDPSIFQSLTLRLKRDDGAIIYMNGQEIVRSNLPSETVYYDTYSAEATTGSSERIWLEYMFPNDLLLPGINICAVEVHQYNRGSSDLSFDLELIGNNYTEITLIDSVIFKPQYSDISYGRNLDNSNEWNYYGNPTPGQPNATIASLDADTSTSVTFSLASGFYTNSQSLELYTESQNAVIRYTTDGSKPTERSQAYSGSILLNSSTVIKAQSFETNKLPGHISTRSYFINESLSNLPIVSLIADSFAMWDSLYGIYTNNYKQREVPISLTYFEPGEAIGFDLNAGVRIGGMNIWRFPQKPLTIYMRGRYGDDLINYHLFENKPIGMFGRIVLRNGGDNWPNAMLRDPMTEAVISGQMDNGYQAYKPCAVYMNGQYWGLHNIREKFDPMFFNTNFKVDPLNYDHLEYSYISSGLLALGVVNGNADDYRSLLQFVDSHDLSNLNSYAHVDSLMDIDSFIDYLIVEMYVVNSSWRHNREFWRPNGGKWQWLIPDLDRGYNHTNYGTNLIPAFREGYPLFQSLLSNIDFHNRFIQRYAAHINSTFDSERLLSIVDSLSENIAPEMPRHIERWSREEGIQSMQAWRNAIDNIKQFILHRSSYALENINNEFNLNGSARLSINIDPPSAGRIHINDVPMLSNFQTGNMFRNIPFTLTAIPAVGYKFVEWESVSNSPTIEMTLSDDQVITARFIRSIDNIIPTNITTDTRLSTANSPYVALGDITVDPNVVLTVDDGVHIKMVSNGSIYIHGQLLVSGTEDDPVIIEPNYDSGVEHWGAICFMNATDSSLISHAEIRGASKGNDPINQKAAISAFNSDITIDNVIIENVEFPIFTQFGKTTLRNSSISTDVICDYINIKYGEGLVENCVFNGNRSPDTDAIDYDLSIGGVIRNNRIYNFRGFNSDGIDIGEQSRDVLITGNILFNSNDKGVSVGQQSTVIVEKNLFIGCNQAIAVKDHSYAYVDHNTFYNSSTAVACFEKNFGHGGGRADVLNSVMSNSFFSSIFVDSLSSMQVSYSLSNTDVLPGVGNITADPLFIYPSIFDLQLQPLSPCFDAGDPASPLDDDGSRADIGAYYEYDSDDFPFEIHNSIVINEINYHSAIEFNPGDWVEFHNPTDTLVNISNWTFKDSDDSHIFTLPSNSIIEPNEYLVVCNDSATFHRLFPSVDNYFGNMEFMLNGDGDRLRLYDDNGVIADYLVYDDAAPWPLEPDGTGQTLELLRPLSDNRLPSNWSASLTNFGTPGRRNSVIEGPIDPDAVPTVYALRQNYPNPFNHSTIIRFDLPFDRHVKVTVYDLQGREVATIHDGALTAGYNKFSWNSGSVGSGVYFLMVDAQDWHDAVKMVKIR